MVWIFPVYPPNREGNDEYWQGFISSTSKEILARWTMENVDSKTTDVGTQHLLKSTCLLLSLGKFLFGKLLLAALSTLNIKHGGARTEVQLVKLSPITMCPAYSNSNIRTDGLGDVEGGSCLWTPATHVGHLDEAPGFCGLDLAQPRVLALSGE